VAIWLEFHDSTLSAVNQTAEDVEVGLDAYVHRWDALSDSWKGTGWMQPVRVLISEVGGRSVVPILPVEISDGHLAVATIIHDHLVRLPFNASGGVRLWLQLTNGDVVDFNGRAVQIDAVGEARFVEDLPADLRPRDAG
jgi:hypothetical protein